jgi:hypothetical protein
MVPHLSTRAFKFLRHISKKSGLQYSDVEIHDMGIRLLTLCQAAAEGETEGKSTSAALTGMEIEAIKFIKQKFTKTGNFPSVRILSTALGYRSSPSGYLMFRRLVSKGILARRDGRLVIAERSLQ